MSEETSDRRLNESSRRVSMPLNAATSSRSSTGMPASGSGSSSRSAEIVATMAENRCSGSSPRRAASQPSAAIASAACATPSHRKAFMSFMNPWSRVMLNAIATITGALRRIPSGNRLAAMR